MLGYEGFYTVNTGSPVVDGFSDSQSIGLSGTWSRARGSGDGIKSRTSSTGWDGAYANVNNTFPVKPNGLFNFVEDNVYDLNQYQVNLASPVDLSAGTYYMSFVTSCKSGDFVGQVGLANSTTGKEVMWGEGWAGSGAHYDTSATITKDPGCKAFGASPSMSNWEVVLWVAKVTQSGTTVSVTMYGYNLNTISSPLPTDEGAATALWSTNLTGVAETSWDKLEIELSAYAPNSTYPSVGQVRLATTWESAIVAPASATNVVWNGGGSDNNWTTTNNWMSGASPMVGDFVTFAGTAQLVNNMNSSFSLGSLTFSNNAGSFSITNAANTLTVSGGITNYSASAQTINVPVSLNTTQAVNAAVGNLICGQNINNNGKTVTFAGGGNITLNGYLTGGGGVVKTGSGTVTIPLPVYPAATYGGGTVIQSGTVALNNPGFMINTSMFSGAGNLLVSGAYPLLLWGTNNFTGTTTVSNGALFVGFTPNQSVGSTISVRDGATFGVNARADTNYVSPNSLIIGSNTGATLQFGLAGISEPGLTGTNNAPIRATNVTVHGTATINIASCPYATNSYPLFTGYSSGTLALGTQPPGYSGKLTVSGATVYYTVTNLDYNYRPFTHPGCLSQAGDFARMKAKVNAGAHPWIDSWNLMTSDGGSFSNYQDHAQQQVIRTGGSGNNYQFLSWDANAAYVLSLRWMISGDNNYADAAVRVLNKWASTCTYVGGDPNAQLIALNGYQLACAAENMHAYTNWAPADLARFQWWFRYGPGFTSTNGWWVGSPEGFLQSHWGQCPEHDWANWDLSNMNQLLAIGVFCDDRNVYNYALNYYKSGYAGGTDVQGNGTINRVVYQRHPGYMGQWQEAGRDQGHAMMGPALLGFFCEIAWNQGDDIFSSNTNQLLTAAEYETKWNEAPESVVENNSIPLVLTTNSVPYVSYFNCSGDRQTDLASASRGNVRMGYDLIYNHYVNIMGLDAPYTGVYMSQHRPEGGGDNDVIGYTTLTHYLDPIAPGAVPAPSAVIAQVNNTAATISWLGSADATSYNVKRSTDNGVSYTTIASGMRMDHYYVDTGLLPGSNYLYVVSAMVNGVETTNSLPVAVQANQLLTGTVIGTAGSWDCCANIYRVFDGSLRDWYDAANTSGDWAGLDLGVSNVITRVGYCPRPGFSGRMVGGQLQGCNVPDFSSGVVTLFTIPSQPADLFPPVMTDQTINNAGKFRYVRYIGPANGSCNVAEVQFYGYSAPTQAPDPVEATAGDSQVTLNWSPVAYATGYKVKTSTTDGGPYSLVAAPAPTSCTVDGLTNGILYYFVVAATNSAGEGTNSVQVSARPVSLVSTNLNFGVSGNQIQLNWPVSHTGWRLQMNTNLAGTNWQDVSGADSTNLISILPTNGNAFFRLVYP